MPIARIQFRRPRARGFTLLELILVCAIIAILGVVLASSMATGFKARLVANNQIKASRESSVALAVIAQDFQSIIPPAVRRQNREDVVSPLAGHFVARSGGSTLNPADSVSFYCLGSDPIADENDPFSNGAREIQIALRSELNPPVLVRRVRRNLLAPTPEQPIEEILARNVIGLGLRYFDGYGWSKEWDSSQRENLLPLAIEMTISLDTPSRVDVRRPYRVVQLIPLACATMVETEEDQAAQ